jgi:HD-GYP domain-containing protein (c-di-GMP phosphodiesterase class II)
MLKKVYRNELAEGMRFSAPVFFDDGENMLVSKGVPIKARELEALDRWKIAYVLTAGIALAESADASFPDEPEELDELDELEDVEEAPSAAPAQKPGAVQPSADMSEKAAIDQLEYTTEQIVKLPEVLEAHELYVSYRDLVQDLHTVFTDIRDQKQIKSRSIDRIVSALFSVLQADRSGIAGFILGGDIADMELAKSSINTAILSIIIGEHLGMPRHRLLQVATGALLHDIGMLKVPDSIVNKTDKLDDNETQLMRSHTFYGYKLIVNELLYADEVGRAAAQHHERWDGDGYPARLAGQNIDIGARIVSVADAFEAMVSPKAWRDSMVGYKAMKSLLADNARRFDPDIIKAMIQSIGIYPVGSIVLMNNSVIARVLETNRDAPLRPKIRVLIDEFAKPYTNNEGDVINLADNRNLFIARAIDPAEYQKVQ